MLFCGWCFIFFSGNSRVSYKSEKKKKFRNDLLRAECVLSKCQNVYLSRCIGSTSDIKVWLAKSETNINKKDKKITYYGHENRLGVDKVKKVVLFPEIGRVKNDLSFNHPNASNAYTVVSEYTIQFQANTHRATNKKQRELNKRKTKETVCEFANLRLRICCILLTYVIKSGFVFTISSFMSVSSQMQICYIRSKCLR